MREAKMAFESLNKYLEATQHHLGVEGERYGGGFRAIAAHRTTTDFLFEMLEGDDLEATEAQAFLQENPLFPSAWGNTPQDALQKLDAKLGVLYRFSPGESVYKWRAEATFKLTALYDADLGAVRSPYDVRWEDIVRDLRSSSPWYYDDAKSHCSDCERRDLHALLNFKYEGVFERLLEMNA
jgi:hypothetical protein